MIPVTKLVTSEFVPTDNACYIPMYDMYKVGMARVWDI
jgi:hypothetical protein